MAMTKIPTIEVKGDEHRTIEGLTAAARRSLGPNEVWCIWDQNGPILESCSTDFVEPIKLVCQAFDADWDELQEQGFYLGKMGPV